jgi:hypothetical protein
MHPWFSQTEYLAMQQIAREALHEGAEIDAAVISQMTHQGIDCHGLNETLLTGADTELSVLYRIFCRKKVTESLRGLIARISVGRQNSGSSPHGRLSQDFSEAPQSRQRWPNSPRWEWRSLHGRR